MALDWDFLRRIVKRLGIDAYGIHGIEHWIRVYENGYSLAESTGANARVLIWFAVLHDSQRSSDAMDHGHGRRAAEFAKQHRTKIDLENREFELLIEALACHTEGCRPEADITVRTCLDADRLDIGRTGAKPDPAWLYTEAAKEMVIGSRKVRRSGNE
jgi:uncharacterized protein